MKETTKNILKELIEKYPALLGCEQDIEAAFMCLLHTYESGKKLLLCGNGGSASDCEHIVGELMKSFKKKRPIPAEEKAVLSKTEEGRAMADVLEGGLKAISLTSHLSLSTAFANDKQPLAVFAQQLYVLGDKGDTLLCISTSGNSKNCVYAATVAKMKGMSVISLTGEKESALSACSDVCVRVPETETYKVQELHLPVYHALCAMLEEEWF
jgi:D-sedoheptulose 7-phosphate isomerase